MRNLIDQLTPAIAHTWVPESVLGLAREDVARGRVSKPSVRARRVDAYVADPKRGRVKVSLYLSGGEIVSACDCMNRALTPCRHAAAVAMLLTGEAQFEAWSSDAPGGSLQSQEVDRRRLRGQSELFDIVAPADGPLGRYAVGSPSAQTYEAVIRAFDQPHNGCTCPDFETNLLGTCKHIEAALHHARRRDRVAVERAQAEGPAASYLYVAPARPQSVTVRFGREATRAQVLRLERFFGHDGRLLRPIAEVRPDLEAAAREAGAEVPREVARLAIRALDDANRRRDRHEIENGVIAAGPDQPGFRTTLYPYQVEGVAFLASRKRALLADDMGLGKTAQAIAAMVRLMRKGDVRRTLIVCPASLKHQWEREILRFTMLRAGQVTAIGGSREARLQQYLDAREVVITSYELARTDHRDLAGLGADLLILDEAQRIKNWRTTTAARIKQLPARHAFVLTGTPLENRLDDLYSLMQVVDPHVLGPLWQFNADFSHLDERGRPIGYKNLDQLRNRMSDVLLRRRKEDVLTQLPPQIVNRLLVPMTPEQQTIHEDAEHQVSMLLRILKRRPLNPNEEQRLMRAFQRMRMACDAAGLVDKETPGAPKLAELESLLDEICLQGGRKVVIFSEWEKMQAMAAEVCQKLKIGHVCLNGGVSTAGRPALIDRFREDPRCKVFLSTDAGGVGLNLQAASYPINLDLPWNPAVLAQRIARVHRLGQTEPVNVVLLVSKGGFEERMESTLVAKRSLFEAVVGDDDRTVELTRASMASKIATLLSQTFAAVTGPEPTADDVLTLSPADPGLIGPAPLVSSVVAISDPEAASRAEMDDLAQPRREFDGKLQRVLRLPNGQLVGVTQAEPPSHRAGSVVLMSATAIEALAAIGLAPPLADAQIVYDASADDDARLAGRRARLAAGERKLSAARHLISGGMQTEALPLLHVAIGLAIRSLVESGDPGDDPAALTSVIYSQLIPAGALHAGGAAALARAGEVARAFAASHHAIPDALLAQIEQDARDALARARERLAQAGSRERQSLSAS
ncbi:MAG: DEAD/DEAH box helicase [Candidatus Sericytochromatia bacterium]|uniref:DEAD/DEAH box helicase n=1 Tax=Candidatus Tanganyikabacteria bacterium TaxID=2961651 RepID=A0A937X3U3_9BACT|nr:DEAD/DEAH box helicase [Candidatus Tanganyikabacteria bacterium]